MSLKQAPNVKWNKDRHKPFKGSSKSKSSKKGRVEKETIQKTAKAIPCKADRKNAFKVAKKLKQTILLEERLINSAIKPIVTIVEITKNGNVPFLNPNFSAIIKYFPHGSPIPNILDATRLSDVLLLAVSPGVPTDEWSENTQFSIRSQGTPSSIAIVVPNESTLASVDIVNEWASYLSDRYSVSRPESKKNIFLLPSQSSQLQMFIESSERRIFTKSSSKKNKVTIPSFVIETFSFNQADRSVTFNGGLRGGIFTENDVIIIPGIPAPFPRWQMSSNLIEEDENSLTSKIQESCNCKKKENADSSSFLTDLISTKPTSHSQNGKHKILEEGISDYQSSWMVHEDSDPDSTNDIEMEEADFNGDDDQNTPVEMPELFDDLYDSEDSSDVISLPEGTLAKKALSEYSFYALLF